MTEIVRRARRWPWIVACVALFFLGVVGGILLNFGVMGHAFRVPCPPIFRPTPEEVAVMRGPGVFPARSVERPRTRMGLVGIARVRGRTMLLARVEADGSVSRVEVVNSSGFCPYDVKAVTDVRNWKFRPATRMGDAIATWVPVTYDFVPGPAPPARPRAVSQPI